MCVEIFAYIYTSHISFCSSFLRSQLRYLSFWFKFKFQGLVSNFTKLVQNSINKFLYNTNTKSTNSFKLENPSTFEKPKSNPTLSFKTYPSLSREHSLSLPSTFDSTNPSIGKHILQPSPDEDTWVWLKWKSFQVRNIRTYEVSLTV